MCQLFIMLFGLIAVREYDISELELAIELLAEKTEPGVIMYFNGTADPLETTLFNKNKRWMLLQEDTRVVLKRLEER